MRRAADGCNPPLRQRLDGAETQAAFEREVAEELARPLAQFGRVGPADVLAARAEAGFLVAPVPGAERSRVAAAKTLDCGPLHGSLVGLDDERRVPETRDSL